MNRPPIEASGSESQVLGAMMQFPAAITDAIEALGKDALKVWYHEAHLEIYKAIIDLFDKSQPVDIVTIGEALKQRGKLDLCGGPAYLAEIASSTASSAPVTHHSELLKRSYSLREISLTSTQCGDLAHRIDADPVALADTFTGQLLHLIHGGENDTEHIGQLVGGTVDDLGVTAEQAKKGVLPGVDTGFAGLNEMTGGFQASDLIILAARPSVGKTALALSWLLRAARSGKNSLIFSMEMSKKQINQRLLAMDSHVDLKKMRMGKMADEDWAKVAESSKKLAELPIYINDEPALTALEVRAKSRRIAQRQGLDFVVVDYLQLMSGESSMNREQQVSTISRGMKAMAKELDCPVIALSQLSRATEARPDRRPQLSDLRESGAIEQDADVVMFIYRPELYGMKATEGESLEGVTEIIVGKQRNGPTDTVRVSFDKTSATFGDIVHQTQPHERREYDDR